MSDSTLLRIDKLSFAYGPAPVLREVSLSLSTGEVLALLGPNGSGKSTLIRNALGHLRGHGGIEWEGRPIRQWSRRRLSRRVAYLPQFPSFEAGQTVAEALRMGRAPYWGAFGLETERDLAVVREVAGLLELTELMDRPLDQLSGGQRQRVFIGRCLVQEPRAMLLDEPSTALDLRHQVELLRLLQKLAREREIGVLMASHDLNLTAMFVDRMLLLSQGAVAAEGTPGQVMQARVLSGVYELPLECIPRSRGTPLVAPALQERA